MNRDRLYLMGILLAAGVLLFLGRGLIERSTLVTWALAFCGTTAVGVLGLALYRVQGDLRASRHELARQDAEMTFALEVQQALFPRHFPADSGLEFAAVCVPARGISGDYYDVLPLSGGRLAFVLADISGKGIPAAILMSNVQAVLRVLAADHTLGELASRLNAHLYEITAAARFATFFYAEWNPADRQLRYINAGHNAPLLVGSGSLERLAAVGPPLGIEPASEYPTVYMTLRPDDLLVIYSDGITEAGSHRNAPFGEARLEALVRELHARPLAEIQQYVIEAARAWTAREPEDDMTLLLVRATAPAKEAP